MYRHLPEKRAFGWTDMLAVALVGALIYGLIGLAQQWASSAQIATEVDLEFKSLPKYAFFSFSRATAAYFLSFVFSLVYGYVAAKSKSGERMLIPLLDILQSIPVLGFLPSLVLGLVAVFPNTNIGIEIACIIMIFTSQAWNMCFSFYSSLKTVPSDLTDVARVIRMSWIQKVRHIELPFAAIGLAWNSLMSMAGGWFFLTVCESFTLGDRKFQLPGMGSYMAVAIEHKNHRAMLAGVVTMSIVIIFVDFVIWRPVMAWVRKFQMEEIPDEVAELPFVTAFLRESWLVRRVKVFIKRRFRRKVQTHFGYSTVNAKLDSVAVGNHGKRALGFTISFLGVVKARIRKYRKWGPWLLKRLGPTLTLILCIWCGIRIWELVRTLSFYEWRKIWSAVGLTFGRVFLATVVSSLWTIPVAIMIGLSPKMTRLLQPIVQVVASFPAPMVYPLVTSLILSVGIGMSLGSSILMMLGIQWYILFNTLAGAMSIPRDLKDSLMMMGCTRATRWWKLYLPSVFPSLVTGWVTAAGGAWNASIVAEYIQYGKDVYVAKGIGAMITQTTAAANFPMLAGSLLAMVITVVGLNQTFWRWLNEIAETKFRFER